MQNENNQLKSTLEKYKQYIEEMQLPWERSSYHEKTIRKIKFFKQDYQQRRYDEEENEESDDGFVTEIRQHRKNNGNV